MLHTITYDIGYETCKCNKCNGNWITTKQKSNIRNNANCDQCTKNRQCTKINFHVFTVVDCLVAVNGFFGEGGCGIGGEAVSDQRTITVYKNSQK